MITIEAVQEECENFLQRHFEKYYEEIDPQVDFIESHELIETKKNMLYTYDFLDGFYQQLRSQHVQFSSDTCNKLYIIIKQLHQTLKSLEDESRQYKKLFEYSFVNDSLLLSNYKLQIEKVKNQQFQPKLLKEMRENYEKLRILYRTFFFDAYLQYRQEIRSSLKWILNTYLLYFDAILWQDALESTSLKRYLLSLTLKKFDTKHLILRQLSTTSKATIRYMHLQKALKAYL